MEQTIKPSVIGQNPLHFMIALALCPVLIGIPVMLLWMLDVDLTRLEIGREGISIRRGIFRQHQIDLSLSQITNIEIRQTALQKLVGAGDLVFSGPDGEQVAVIHGVRRPEEVRDLIRI